MNDREKIRELERKADWFRERTLEMCISAKTGHVTSSFSCAEIMAVLYQGGILRYNPHQPKWADRDRFILSKGQASPILYATLADAGFFPKSWLDVFCKKDGKFGVHLQCDVPGVEFTTGSLGHGLGLGVGTALAAKMDQNDYHVFILLGDAELQEGSNWESAMAASHYKLNNITAIIDRNGYGVLCPTEDAVGINPLDKKFEAFGWEVKKVDGHSVEELLVALGGFRPHKRDYPLVVIADTVKGKGIESWENVALRHGTAPIGEEAELTRRELKNYISKREQKYG